MLVKLIERVKMTKGQRAGDGPIAVEVEKDEVAFLSANTWDVSGGGNYGFNSVWVNRNNNIFDNLDYKPQNEVKDLKQLIDII